MSHLRFNERELVSYAVTASGAALKGPVKKLSKKYKSKYLWLVLKGNLLFIFKSQSEPSHGDNAHSCYILESCHPETTDAGFRVVFNYSNRQNFLSFICPKDQTKVWVQTIKESSFRYLRNCIKLYEDALSKLQTGEGGDSSVVDELPSQSIAIFSVEGLQTLQSDCFIQFLIYDEAKILVLQSSFQPKNTTRITFPETLHFHSDDLKKKYTIHLQRSSSAAKQSCFITFYSADFHYGSIRTFDNAPALEHVYQIKTREASGILSINFVNMSDGFEAVMRQSNHRSSCLFTDTIQPLPMGDKDELFSSLFSETHKKYILVNAPDVLNGSKPSLLEESLLNVQNNVLVTGAFLDMLIQSDIDLLFLLKGKNGSMIDGEVTSTKNLEFRIDINSQHKNCLNDVFGKFKRHKSLKKSCYQTLYYPSNLATYRVKIMFTSMEHYEIFEKTVLSTPTKTMDGLKEGGLYSMLCNDHIKQSFYLAKKFTQLRDKMNFYSSQLQTNTTLIARSLANHNFDEFTRRFKDYEAVVHSLLSICTNAEVADLAIELAVVMKNSKSALHVWLNDEIILVDGSWSVASNLRDLMGQIEELGERCSGIVGSLKCDQWVEYLFLPCHKFQRDLESLIAVSNAALDYKIHSIQNVNSSMNRFTMRSDAVMAQLLLAVINTFYSSIYIYMDDVFFWLQLLNVGYFIQLESLLSCRGTDRILLEDIYVAAELLKNCKIEIVCKDLKSSLPSFKGSRYNLLISVPVPTRIYALLLDVCQGHSNRKISILPMFCNQVINKSDACSLTETESKFIQTINNNGSVDFTKKLLESHKVFYQSIEDKDKFSIANEMLGKLRDCYQMGAGPSQILPLFQRLGKSLCAGK